jgi:hypothetical protein
MSTVMTTSVGSMCVTCTGPSGAMVTVAVGSIGLTGTFTAPAAGSIGLFGGPTGPTGAASFVDADSFGANAVVQAEAILQHTGVPTGGELILCLFIRPEHQKERLACFEERFNDWKRRFGAPTARRLYYRHAIRSIFDMLKIGVIGALIDWIWDHLFGGKP